MINQGFVEDSDAKNPCWGLQQAAKIHLPTAISTVRRPSLPTSPRRFSLSTPEENSPSTVEKQEQDEPESINYLAYGSNLAAGTFLGRRGIKPLSAVNVRVPSLELTFDLPGLPYLEPCFANVREVSAASTDGSEATPLIQRSDSRWDGGLIGVVYAVTPEDYRTIIATEGGGASYKDVVVQCEVLSPGPTVSSQGQTIQAHTLFAPLSNPRPNKKPAQASARYLNIIKKGAAEHDLPADYQKYLLSLQPYKITTARQFVGAAIFASLWVPLMLIVITLMKMFADKDGNAPDWMVKLQRGFSTVMWGSYDIGYKPLFGDGERTIEKEEDGDEGQDMEVVREKTGS